MIIALTGQRRVGKSYILRDFSRIISTDNPRANIIFINKERKEYYNIKTDADLDDYLSDKIKHSLENYLLIDEVQDIKGFENTLRSLNAEEECQIIITGSNAKMLSSELSTYLGGRYIDIHVHSLSYQEFLEFHNLIDSSESLEKFLTFGGMPHLYRLGLDNVDLIWEYLQNIFNTIVLKDVVEREGIRNITLFENLLAFVSDNVGQLVSGSSISKYLKSQKIDITTLSVINYLKSASNAYIINKVARYDIHGRKLLESNDKFFFEDLGLRNILIRKRWEGDIEKRMENVVYLHLKNLGFNVKIGSIPNGEIDFVVEKNGKTIYIQVAYLITNENTMLREFGNLLKIKDNYPKYVVSMNPEDFIRDHDGIKHVSLRRFLMSEDL